MVHISEVARTYVNDVKEFVKVGDVVKMKVLNIGEDGKVSLSIKRALDPKEQTNPENAGKGAAPLPRKSTARIPGLRKKQSRRALKK